MTQEELKRIVAEAKADRDRVTVRHRSRLMTQC